MHYIYNFLKLLLLGFLLVFLIIGNVQGNESQVKLTPEEQAWLDQNPTVRVYILDYPPYMIVKSNEAPQGIVIEYLKLIGKRSGITFKFETSDLPFAEFMESMERFQGPDLLPLLRRTAEREQFLSFSETYISSPYVIFVREQDEPILDINGLAEKTVAVTRGVVLHDKLTKDYPGIRLALFDSHEKALQALTVGQVDAYIGNLIVASYIANRNGFSNLQVTGAIPFREPIVCMANRKDWPELTSIINKVLAGISEEEKTTIRKKYLSIKYEQGIDKAEVLKWVLIVGAPILVIMLLFVFWGRSMAREVRKRTLAEQSAEEARDAAEAANLAKSTFLSNMSHELRTPLTAILGFTRILNRDTSLTKDQHEQLEIINRSGEHLQGMVDDILSLAKIEAGRVELKQYPFDVGQMLQDVGQMMKSRSEDKGLRFSLELDPALPAYMKGDAGKLRQVLINLLGNAVKFTETGGVWLRARSQPATDDPDGVMLQLEVQDSGPGMPHDRLDEAFGSFVQLGHGPETQGGTGLGLAISKTLVDMMGGEITAESEPGQGALFTVNVPCKLSEAGTEMGAEAPVAEVVGLASGQPDWRILVVDDNKENRLLLRDLLSQVGFSILEAKDGEEAIKLFSQWQPHFIWMDIRMPVMDGYEATHKIRELPGGAEVKIVAVTASVFKEDRGAILGAGCDGLVRKPFQNHEIFDAMTRHLEVCYIYSEREGGTDGSLEKPIELTTEMLSELPRELLLELRESTLVLDQEATLHLIERIKGQAPETADGLRSLLENFQMGRLDELLAEVG